MCLAQCYGQFQVASPFWLNAFSHFSFTPIQKGAGGVWASLHDF